MTIIFKQPTEHLVFLPPTKCQKQPGDFDMKDLTPQGDVNPVAGGRSA